MNGRALLVVGVLALAVSASLAMRSLPVAQHGYDLHEFDPFFNYRATEYIVENGLAEYMEWHDELSWYGHGRDISATSQVMLHATAAGAYAAFGAGSDLYDFAVMFPVVVGSLTVLAVFALVRLVGGTGAGLAAALLYSVSLPVVLRGSLGWFKSEPLGVFYGLIAMCLMLYAAGARDGRRAIACSAAGGAVLVLGVSAWGGATFFLLVAALFFPVLPFTGVRAGRLARVAVPFAAAALAASLAFERPGPELAAGFGGIALASSAAAALAAALVRQKSSPQKSARNGALVLAAVALAGALAMAAGPASDASASWVGRYLYAVAPFLEQSAAGDSVSEHAVPTAGVSFFYHSTAMVLALPGAWYLFSRLGPGRRGRHAAAFALVFAMAGVYVGASLVRLELLASLGLAMLAGVAVSEILSRGPDKLAERLAGALKIGPRPARLALKCAAAAGLAALLAAPLALPEGQTRAEAASVPPNILNGGTWFQGTFEDWPAALAWIKHETPPGSVVAAWWDYGYWITAVSERPTLADNATLMWPRIQNMAEALLSEPDEAWRYFQSKGADYVLVFVAAERYTLNGEKVFALAGGGEESKLPSIIPVAGMPLERFLHSDGLSPNAAFWETAMGKMFPYEEHSFYADELASDEFFDGSLPLYAPSVKYPPGGDGPFRLAYASPSFVGGAETVLAVMIYEVNDGYSPVPAG